MKMVAQGPGAQLAPEKRPGKVHADKNMRGIYDFGNEEVIRQIGFLRGARIDIQSFPAPGFF
jgi:hypothetical protein